MFNKEARWDRNLPQENPSDLNEPIRVIAEFEKSKIIPRYFFWHKKLFRIKRVTYFWQERQGREVLNLFSVETPAGLYQISFNNQSLSWRLNKII